MPLRDRQALRDAAIRALLAEGWTVEQVVGLDRGHLLARRVEDLPGFPAGIASYLRGKGLIARGEQACAVEPETADALSAYLATRRDPYPWLFQSARRQRVSPRTVWRVKRAQTCSVAS